MLIRGGQPVDGDGVQADGVPDEGRVTHVQQVAAGALGLTQVQARANDLDKAACMSAHSGTHRHTGDPDRIRVPEDLVKQHPQLVEVALRAMAVERFRKAAAGQACGKRDRPCKGL
jgi:hypothetical protein